ncbi:hypothetical protein [Halococcus salsus]|uniref:hypothetical protein n=1 Tax=Halococcus salsus TaxID=2162894 RepID=UPI0018657E5F|nr:hypothetical protein [Halococcus salsus]
MTELSSRVRFAVILTIGVAVPGALAYLFSMSGFSQIATIVWVVGYGGAIIAIWYNWIRPIDFEEGNHEASVDKEDSSNDHQPATDNTQVNTNSNSAE